MENLDHCPICSGEVFQPFIKCIDHTVSKETFQIVECSNCAFRYTNPRPDQEAIAAYYKAEAYVSHTNTSKGLVNKAYHKVRKITLKQKLNLLNNYCTDKSLLDYGSGAGAFLSHCKNNGWNVLGLEPDPDARNVAKKDFDVEAKPIEDIQSIEDNSKGAITLWHVLEHVHALKPTIKELKRILKKDGTLFIAVPNCSSYDAEKYGANWAAYDVPRHLYHFRPQDIKTLFSEFDMDLVEVLPMKYDAFYVSMLSEKIQEGSMLKGVLTGWKSNRKANSMENTYSSQIYVLQNKS